ncbi:MAG: hypothetical protein ACHQ9S_26890 [Candidatus Binatia bacterium]
MADGYEVCIDFSARQPVGITVAGTGGDGNTLIEEIGRRIVDPIDEMRVRKWGPWLAANQTIRAVVFLVLLIFGAEASFIAGSGLVPWRLDRTMWLTASDIEYVKTTTNDGHVLTNGEVLEILTRQMRNLAEEHDRGMWYGLVSWRLLLRIGPILLVSVGIIYNLWTCYPAGVFYWGHGRQKFDAILSRRRMVWTTIVGATIVSLAANIATGLWMQEGAKGSSGGYTARAAATATASVTLTPSPTAAMTPTMTGKPPQRPRRQN